MSQWKQVWDLAVHAFAHEPIEIRIAIGLTIALTALMIAEGIRASFIPPRRREAMHASRVPHPGEQPKPALATAEPDDAPQQFAAPAARPAQANRKRGQPKPRTQRGTRPTIRRPEISEPRGDHDEGAG
jgi:hypothetical protein